VAGLNVPKKSCVPLRFVVVLVLALAGGMARAAVVRFHYLPADSPEQTTLRPAGSGVGERSRWFGTVRAPYNGSLRPTHVVTFRHPYTGRNVSVPVALPEGTPNILHGPGRVTFNYGSYTVGAHFLPDGSVDIVYDSGFLRDP
jgi:hypothetical protein